MRVYWTPRALTQLTKLRAFIAKDSEASAARLVGKLLDSIDLLTAQPAMGRPGRIPGTRELVVPGTSYIVPYRVRRETLEIHGIFHGKQKWPKRL